MGYFRRGALIERIASTATSNGTLTLSSSSRTFQRFTGSSNHTVVLPDATTFAADTTSNGYPRFVIENRSTGSIKVNANGGGFVALVPAGADRTIHLADTSTAAGVWDAQDHIYGIDVPLRLHAGSPVDSKIYISPNTLRGPDGSALSTGLISTTLPSVAASTLDFQTGSTTGATFTVSFPSTTVGQFRRVGFTLLPDGSITVLFSAAAASVGALALPGTVFSTSGIAIGYVDVEATASTAFKTAGSATSIIEPDVGGTARIVRIIGAGGGGSGGGLAGAGTTAPSGGSFPYTLSSTDDGKVIEVDTTAARTINAHAAATGFKVTIKDISGQASLNNITFVKNGSQTIEFLSSNYIMEADYGVWSFVFNGTNWDLVG